MAEFHCKVTINRAPEDVFSYLINPDNMTVWQSGLQEFDADWQVDPKVGEHARGVVKVAGKKVRWETETTEVTRPERIAFRSVKAPFSYEMSYTLADRDGATELSHDGFTESLGGFFGKLADPLVARMYQRDMNSNLNNLKALLEET